MWKECNDLSPEFLGAVVRFITRASECPLQHTWSQTSTCLRVRADDHQLSLEEVLEQGFHSG
jgi:hypothetical protein